MSTLSFRRSCAAVARIASAAGILALASGCAQAPELVDDEDENEQEAGSGYSPPGSSGSSGSTSSSASSSSASSSSGSSSGSGGASGSSSSSSASSSSSSAGGGGQMLTYPAELLDLTDWKITLPIGSPDEIKQPELDTFEDDTYFHLSDDQSGVVFQAHAGGATTSNSGYPRSELREMDGSSGASWSTTEGTHTLIVEEAITHLPEVKPHVVAAQIHDAEDDVVMVRLEGENLFIEADGESVGVLDPNYVLGTFFTVKFVASEGHIEAYYNDELKVDYERSTTGCYFKTGCYTQSNTSKGDEESAYGQVVIKSVQIIHE